MLLSILFVLICNNIRFAELAEQRKCLLHAGNKTFLDLGSVREGLFEHYIMSLVSELFTFCIRNVLSQVEKKIWAYVEKLICNVSFRWSHKDILCLNHSRIISHGFCNTSRKFSKMRGLSDITVQNGSL